MFLHVLLKDGEDGLAAKIEDLKTGIKSLMALLGCRKISELKDVQRILDLELKNTVDQL